MKRTSVLRGKKLPDGSIIGEAIKQFDGMSGDEIAAYMKKMKVRGRVGTTYKCPLAVFLSGQGHGQYVVGAKHIIRRSGKTIEMINTPRTVKEFLIGFDTTGRYPDLLEPPPRCLPPAKNKPHDSGKNKSSGRRPRGHRVHHLAKLVGRFDHWRSNG